MTAITLFFWCLKTKIIVTEERECFEQKREKHTYVVGGSCFKRKFHKFSQKKEIAHKADSSTVVFITVR